MSSTVEVGVINRLITPYLSFRIRIVIDVIKLMRYMMTIFRVFLDYSLKN